MVVCGLAAAGWALRASAQARCGAPRVRMKMLLNGVEVGPGGRLSAVCLPAPARRGETNDAYNPYDGGKLSTVLKSSNGQALNSFV